MKLSALQRLMARLAAFQTRRPWLVLLLAIVTIIPSAWAVSSLRLRSAFQELLPDDKPSVIELKKVNERLSSASTLTVVAESQNTELLKRFVDEMTPKLRALPEDLVTAVDPGPRMRSASSRTTSTSTRRSRTSRSCTKRSSVPTIVKSRRKRGSTSGSTTRPNLRPPDPTRRSSSSASRMRSPIFANQRRGWTATTSARKATSLRSWSARPCRRWISARTSSKSASARSSIRGYAKVDPNFRVSYTGNLITSAEQYKVVNEDLIKIGASGVALVLLVVFLYFLRIRSLLALGLSIGIGCLWSLAFARVSVGYLNIATGFLVSIIAGNGINAMVIWMARYLEARRSQHQDMAESVKTASVETCEATLAVVGVAMVSYGALMTTDFRGFRHFGIIGGAGMLLCWIATYAILPAIFVLSERIAPLPVKTSWRDKLGATYGRPFAWIAKALPIGRARRHLARDRGDDRGRSLLRGRSDGVRSPQDPERGAEPDLGEAASARASTRSPGA